jgi:hypothetical protein
MLSAKAGLSKPTNGEAAAHTSWKMEQIIRDDDDYYYYY